MNENIKSGKILIVDDTPENIDVVRALLEEEGYETIIATNGEKAILRGIKTQPDLVLLDIQMPGIDGFETCKRMKELEEFKDVPIIYLSALADTNNIIKGFKYGAVDYITKPFKAEEVLTRVENQLQMAQMRNEVIKLNASKDKFFSIIAHDLKNPFSVLFGFSEILLEEFNELTNDEKVDFISRIKETSQKSFKLLENLLQWSRSQTNRLKIEKNKVFLKSLIEEVILELENTINAKEIKIKLGISEEHSAFVDKESLRTVFLNLIDNAVKYSHPNSMVEVRSYVQDEYVYVDFEDYGTGINDNLKSKLFLIAESIKTPGTKMETGTGLGLIISKEFLKKNNADLYFESAEGKGSTFTAKLPMK